MYREDRATSDTSILFQLGEMSQFINGSSGDEDAVKCTPCSGPRRGSKSGSGVSNRRGGGGDG